MNSKFVDSELQYELGVSEFVETYDAYSMSSDKPATVIEDDSSEDEDVVDSSEGEDVESLG